MNEPRSTLPKITPPVLKRRAAAFDNSDWLFELKYDGFRALLEIDGAGTRLLSRNRNRFRQLDMLAAALAKRLRVNDAILDGEVNLRRRDGPADLHRSPPFGARARRP
jgi:bifunctional non-homologous end joining protein LigD